MIVIRRQAWLFLVAILTLLLLGCLNLWVIRRGGGIEEVALVQTIAYGVNFTMLFFLSHIHLNFSIAVWLQYFRIILKFSWMLLLLTLISKNIRLENPVWSGALQTFLLLLAYIPFLFQLEKRYHLARVLYKKLGIAPKPPLTADVP